MTDWIDILDCAILKYDEEESIFNVKCIPHSVLSSEVVEEIVKTIRKLSQGRKYGVLIDFRHAAYIMSDACHSSYKKNSQMVAMAIIVDYEKHKAIMELFSDKYEYKAQYKIFTDEDAAVSWLKENIKQAYKKDN